MAARELETRARSAATSGLARLGTPARDYLLRLGPGGAPSRPILARLALRSRGQQLLEPVVECRRRSGRRVDRGWCGGKRYPRSHHGLLGDRCRSDRRRDRRCGGRCRGSGGRRRGRRCNPATATSWGRSRLCGGHRRRRRRRRRHGLPSGHAGPPAMLAVRGELVRLLGRRGRRRRGRRYGDGRGWRRGRGLARRTYQPGRDRARVVASLLPGS